MLLLASAGVEKSCKGHSNLVDWYISNLECRDVKIITEMINRSPLDNCTESLHHLAWKTRSALRKKNLMGAPELLEILVAKGVSYRAVPMEAKTEFLRTLLLTICKE